MTVLGLDLFWLVRGARENIFSHAQCPHWNRQLLDCYTTDNIIEHSERMSEQYLILIHWFSTIQTNYKLKDQGQKEEEQRWDDENKIVQLMEDQSSQI